jgi:hypothetical protein
MSWLPTARATRCAISPRPAGSGEQWVANVNGTTRATQILGTPLPPIDFTGSYDAKGFAGRATAHEPGIPLKATFDVHPDGSIDGSAEAKGVDLSRAPRLQPYFDGRGLVNTMSANPDVVYASRARSEAGDTGDDGPNILTSGTGGMMIHGIDDIGRAIGMVANDTSSYYVIGYAPENATMDGKFRSIEVKSKAQGINIRARKGYLAVNLPPQEFIKRAGYWH